jgi:collagenase-like PrtC family protease
MTSSPLQFITFASTEAQVKSALHAGATHLILEDSKLSLRSFNDDFSTPGFDKLIHLATVAKTSNPQCSISFNLDIMPHATHFPLIHQLVGALTAAQISIVRVQDPGLSEWFRENAPHISLILNTETGNQNTEGIAYYSTLFKGQVLVNDIPKADIHRIIGQIPSHHFEIQVQGPILIQNSPRPFLNKIKPQLPHSQSPITVVRSQAHEYPGRFFTFYQNPHAHLMYSYFDKSLLRSIPDLVALNLSGWIIDGRGYDDAYTATCLTLYRSLYQRYSQNPDTYQVNTEDSDALDKVATLPQKPGFFKINQTDQDRPKKSDHSHIEIGVIIDAIKGEWVCAEVKKSFHPSTPLKMITPEGKHIPIAHPELVSIWDTPLVDTLITPSETPLIKFKWQKGCQIKSRLVLDTEII